MSNQLLLPNWLFEIMRRVRFNMPLVSIITPAYNCSSTIRETYESIKQQSFNDFEWIVVEDHSTDDSFLFIEEMVKHDERVVLLQTPTNSGAAVARNLGIEKAKGRYIAFLDADDLWVKDKLQKQLEFMKANGYSFTFTNYEMFSNSGHKGYRLIKHNLLAYKDLLKSNRIGCSTVIYDSSVLGRVYMPLDCEKREDHGAWLDITRNGTKAYLLEECLTKYRVESGSVSSNKFKMIKYQYRVYRKHEKMGPIKSAWYLFLCSLNRIFRR